MTHIGRSRAQYRLVGSSGHQRGVLELAMQSISNKKVRASNFDDTFRNARQD